MNYLNDLEVSMEQYNRWYKNIKKSKAGYSFMIHILEDGTTHRRKVEIREDLGLRCKSIDGKSWHRIELRQEEEELEEWTGWVRGIKCNVCDRYLPIMKASEFLDVTNPLLECPHRI